MNFLTESRIYFGRKMKETLGNPIMLSITVFVPVMYLLLYAPLLKNLKSVPGFPQGNVLNMFLPGMLVSFSIFGGAFAGFRLIDEIRQGIIERFRVTPTSRVAILTGAMTRDAVNVQIQALVFTLLALPFGLQVHWGGFLLLMVLLLLNTCMFAAFSYAIALRFQSEDTLVPFAQMVSLPLLLLAGFLLPMDLAPGWLKAAAHADPVYYSVTAARALTNGQWKDKSIWEAFAITTPAMLAVLAWASKSFKKVIR
jgi:ABC-2 type transport system permease protein